jgi:arginine decarboxylase
MRPFGLDLWGNDNYTIEGETINLNYGSKPSLLEIVQEIRLQGHKGPLILRFPHLIAKQITTLFDAFNNAKEIFGYRGEFQALFPLKVNQFPNFVTHLMEVSSPYPYGLEAGSKAELTLAMCYTPLGKPITINGFKDQEMISLAFIGAKMGHNITVTIEGLEELKSIILLNQAFNGDSSSPLVPHIGMRIRLHSQGSGIWAKSGGYASKFGLTSTELLQAYELLKKNSLLEHFTMLHFHIGSQLNDINPLKKALREAGHIYADLKNRGAFALRAINIGGGLAIEYAQHPHKALRNYSLREFANDVVFMMQDIAKRKGIKEPDIFTESGRFIAAPHSVLVAPVLELFSKEYHESHLRLKEINPPLIQELYALYNSMNREYAREYLHDALDYFESLLTLFDLGYIDLQDRSNTETLVHLIIKKAIALLQHVGIHELKRLENKIQEKYLINFSLFESLADLWGLQQHFPVVPLQRLDTPASTPASLWDITCDSDGEIPFDPLTPLYLHDIDIEKEEYFLGFFLTGAYQEILGMKHNLFTHPTEAVITFDEKGAYHIQQMILADTITEVLDDLHYNSRTITQTITTIINQQLLLSDDEKSRLIEKLYLYLSENSYLKTIQTYQEERE